MLPGTKAVPRGFLVCRASSSMFSSSSSSLQLKLRLLQTGRGLLAPE
jgi:hypothetical protein